MEKSLKWSEQYVWCSFKKSSPRVITHKILLMILITYRLKVVYNFSLVKHDRAGEIQQSRKNPRTRDTIPKKGWFGQLK